MAANPCTDEETLAMLAKDTDAAVREAVAANEEVNEKTLRKFIGGGTPIEQGFAARNDANRVYWVHYYDFLVNLVERAEYIDVPGGVMALMQDKLKERYCDEEELKKILKKAAEAASRIKKKNAGKPAEAYTLTGDKWNKLWERPQDKIEWIRRDKLTKKWNMPKKQD